MAETPEQQAAREARERGAKRAQEQIQQAKDEADKQAAQMKRTTARRVR